MDTQAYHRTMKLDEDDEETASRHCWECVRRRVVCDRALPTCRKCLKAGKRCPGYDEQKPLQWIENGKVTSRKAKKEITPKLPASSSTAGAPPSGHDHEIQQLSMSVLTVVDGRLAHQHQRANTATYNAYSATPPITYPQYPPSSSQTMPTNMAQPMRYHDTTSHWNANSRYQNVQYSNATTARVPTRSTYPQMSVSSSIGYNGHGQTQQQYQTAPPTWSPEEDPSEVHAQFLFL